MSLSTVAASADVATLLAPTPAARSALIEAKGIVKIYPTVSGEPVLALDHVDLAVKDGEFVCLVGPSGCGKSTILRMIAGLEPITGGEIAVNGRVVNDDAPRERDIAMVFQDYALYPHMNVFENMAFSLRYRGVDKPEIGRRVDAAAKILEIEELLHRLPRQLSGGQRQRVAMGRAIVRDPKVFLFDEPLSNLDAKLRVAMRAEIKALHQRLKTTTVYVTHDQVEAMTMADRIVVMHDGRIEQIGTPLELYDRPGNLFVAQFIGSPAMNVVQGTVRRAGGAPHVEVEGGAQWPLDGGPGVDGQAVSYGIRPEHLTLAPGGKGVPGEIIVVEPTGAETELLINVGGSQVILRTHGRPRVSPDEKVHLAVDPANVHLFDRASGQRLAA
jgi:multiple sugar transport system ATP-binding protein